MTFNNETFILSKFNSRIILKVEPIKIFLYLSKDFKKTPVNSVEVCDLKNASVYFFLISKNYKMFLVHTFNIKISKN